MRDRRRRGLKIALAVLAAAAAGTALFFYLALFRGIYSFSDRAAGGYEGPAALDFLGEDAAYQVMANRYGEPIFTDSAAAFDQAATDYAQAIQLVRDAFGAEYGLGPFSPEDYHLYKALGWQLPTEDEEVREQGSALTRFLDIYENSQKRWYLTPMGWQRVAP